MRYLTLKQMPRVRALGVALLLGAQLIGCASTCPVIPTSERDTFLAVRPEEGGYEIQPGDRLQVEVWQNQQLTRQVRVRPDGKITLPLVNEVEASGQTVPQFQARLSKRLRTYIKDPVVSITVTSFNQKRIFVQGQVRTSAAYDFTGDMFLLQALTLAGGKTPFAEGCAVIVRRKGQAFVRYDVKLEPLLAGRDLKQNIRLQPGDVVTVY